MKIKLFEYFGKDIKLDAKSISKLLMKYNILCDDWHFSSKKDGSIDIVGDVYLGQENLLDIPIKFNRVQGDFNINNNGITSLFNSPINVTDDFMCNGNDLSTLLNGPKYVGGRYDCYTNKLKDVYGFPEFIGGGLDIFPNPVCEILQLVTKTDIHFKSLYKFIKFLNEYTAIRKTNPKNGFTDLIESRLMDALYEVGIEKLEKSEFENYRLI